jgi:XTP/dITP diphosphohydrolase
LRLVLATRNRDKIQEILQLISGPGLEILTYETIDPFPLVDETGSTLEENALQKARAVSEVTGFPALADDTGLEVDALDGAPGVFSSRFAGPAATYEDNVRKLLDVMESIPDSERTASFRCVAAIWLPGGTSYVAEGVTRGVIRRTPAGRSGFGYDPVFYIPDLDKTYAQLTLKEKNAVSHRALAMKKVSEILRAITEPS